LHSSVTLRHPSAAAFLEGSLFCVHSFLYLPVYLVSYVLQMVGFFFQSSIRVFGYLNTFISLFCRVDNRLPSQAAPSELSAHLQEWSTLRISAKSAYLSENEANNIILHVAVSILQSSCSQNDSNDDSASCPAVCNSWSCCMKSYVSFTDLDSDKPFSQHSNQESDMTDQHARLVLRAQLQATRAQLRSMQSPLQQEAQGFDSWSHVLTSINPFSRTATRSLTTSLLNDNDVIVQRRALHKRMCRINKWHLLLRLHHMPWLRQLRRHALVHPPSQPHLAWRSTALLLSNNMMQAASAAVSFHMQSLRNPEQQAHSDDDALGQRIIALQAIIDLHSRMLASLQSERISLRASGQERAIGCGCCCTLPCSNEIQILDFKLKVIMGFSSLQLSPWQRPSWQLL
jgi:hypothetical protein